MMNRKAKYRTFLIKDMEVETTVEVVKVQKKVFDYIEQYLDNLEHEYFDPSDESFEILYNDGEYDFINCDYDGHKIKRKNIASMVYTNPCTSVVYGNFEINEYGVVNPSFEEIVNLVELTA